MKWFCPYCWHEVREENQVCPYCEKDLSSFHNMDFDDKLILGLNNPIVSTRMFIIELIGKRRVLKAVCALCNLLNASTDTYELLTGVNSLFHLGTPEAIECIRELYHKKDNAILKKHIESLFEYNLRYDPQGS